MLNAIIRTALRYRLLTALSAVALLVYGSWVLTQLPIDVFPDLNRPRVTIMVEAPGLAPEEVEMQVTAPLEVVVGGAPGVLEVRSSSGIGISVVNVEFDWGTDIFLARQIVTERIASAADRLPEGAEIHLTPISSIMGQFLQIGLVSKTGETSPREIRSLADWVISRRLLNIPGVAQVATMGGGRAQYQVLVDADALLAHGVTLHEVETAVAASNGNGAGGYLDQGSKELLVRSLGRLRDVSQLEQVVVLPSADRPILLSQVARVVIGDQIKRGDAAVDSVPAVMLTISKQPGADTRGLTDEILRALDELRPTLPKDVEIVTDVYQQKQFIDLSIHNVIEALRDGGILVVIVLFLFLMNFRTTFITLTAIPLSIVVTAIVFYITGQSINTMTLGGLAVAIGELVDDAIVDVENIYRRLRENRLAGSPRSDLRVVYEASSEVRSSIVFSTLLVVLVFIPLFALEGIEGRLFVPLAIAYIVSIVASLFVSLTVTPVLSYWLLPHAKATEREHDGLVLRVCKWLAGSAIAMSLRWPRTILTMVLIAVAVSLGSLAGLGRDFLPPFNEGSVQLNVVLPPGASLESSNRVGRMVELELLKVPEVTRVGRRTGRAELDEHVEGVNTSEIIISLDPESHRERNVILDDIRERVASVPGVVFSAEQPLQHLISHMLSGVKAQIGIKIYGDDLNRLRRAAQQVKADLEGISGVTDVLVEQQTEIPQLQIALKPAALAAAGLTTGEVNEFIETALGGRTVSQVIQGDRRLDLVVRLDDQYRHDLEKLRRLSILLPTGGRLPLEQVADIRHASGPNTINRENARRRIVVQCNVAGRDLGSTVDDIQSRLTPLRAALPAGYFIELGGQFESQQQATQRMLLLGLASLAGMLLALYTLFRSLNLSLQVLSALPMAAIGAIAALWITGQSLTVASMVGFVSLSGIASRNGILLIAHYQHLVRHEGESFTPQMIVRAGQERVAPMLMTALTAGIALIPLALAAGEPGKEILYPVATVILGGLISSTLLDFFVHPALFWLFGRKQAEAQLSADGSEDALLDTGLADTGRAGANLHPALPQTAASHPQ
jgi:CzcA family heavy metal efflux pump